MPRITPETIIAPVIGIALLAALALGGVAFALSRHEEAFRQDDPLIPVIMLTAKGEEFDKVLGLELGADDYVTKPFGLRELAARIAAQLRRRQSEKEKASLPPAAPDRFAFGRWEIERCRLRAVRGDESAGLTLREIALLELFAAHPGEALSRDRIMKEVWGASFQSSRTLDQHLVALRRKLEPPRLIETVYGIGYRYAAE